MDYNIRLGFSFENEDQLKELKSIIGAEAKHHFNQNEFTWIADHWGGNCAVVEIEKHAYIRDIQNSKKKMYEEHKDYIEDFVSDVEENLSFVSEVSSI